MKHIIFSSTAASLMAIAFMGAGQTVLGQASVQTMSTDQGNVQSTTITSAGTISEFNPDTIVVKGDDSTVPVHYTYSKTTTYVDQDGNPVSMETVKSGLPVTVYYIKDGDNLVASKVVVRKSVNVIQPAPAMQDTKSTTTTTTTGDK
jgi:uncharacterized membrane protein